MLMQLAVGAEMDIASGAELAGHTDKLGKLISAGPPKPRYPKLVSSVTATGSVVTLDLGNPPAGWMWNLLGAVVVGNDDHTVLPGAMAVYLGDPVSPSLAGLVEVGITMPSSQTFTKGVYWCHSSEKVFMQSSVPIAAGNNVTGIVFVAEWRAADVIDGSGRP